MFDHMLMLKERHRQDLAARRVRCWTFEQHVNEGVLIPAGCPHQVRNLRSCIKAAIDFVSPEHIAQCMDMKGRLRRCALELRARQQHRAAAARAAQRAQKDGQRKAQRQEVEEDEEEDEDAPVAAVYNYYTDKLQVRTSTCIAHATTWHTAKH